jgi:D-tyrosyl-tRNA(Tyr) deacylase
VRAVVQRVSEASVTVDDRVVGAIDRGLLVLLGITHHDNPDVARRLAEKVWGLRIFDDEAGVMNLPVAAVGGSVLVVSQFTLYGDTRRGRRPSYVDAAPGPIAEPLVETFVAALGGLGARVETGIFGAEMAVASVNDGPVTLLVELG